MRNEFIPRCWPGCATGCAARIARARLFDDVTATAAAAGLLRGRRRVLDYTPLFDPVATQDTVIQLRVAIRKVLSAPDRAD